MPTKGQQQAAEYLALTQKIKPEELATSYQSLDPQSLIMADRRIQDMLQSSEGAVDENLFKKIVSQRTALAYSPEGRAQLAQDDLADQTKFAQDNVQWWRDNPNGHDMGTIGNFMESVFPMIVVGAMGAGALGAFGDAAASTGTLGATGAGEGLGASLGDVAAGIGGAAPIDTAALGIDGLSVSAGGAEGAGALGAGAGAGAGTVGGSSIGVAGGAPAVVTIGPPAGYTAGASTAGLAGTSATTLGTLGSLLASGSGADPIGTVVSGGQQYGADAAGKGFTYDMYGDVIPNEAAASTQAAQTGAQTAANLSNGLTATGGLTPEQYAAASKAAASGTSLTDIAKNILGSNGTTSAISTLANALGTAFKANNAGNAASTLASGSREAAGILAPAITQAAGLQAAAATGAGKTLADAAKAGAGLQSQGALDAATGVSNAALSGASLQGNAALGTSHDLASAATSGGARLSAAQLQAAAMIAAGHQEAAGQKVAGYNEGITTADSTLAAQTANLKPYTTAGTDALTQLMAGLKEGGQFNRPFTMADAQNMDAYKFALGQGKEAIGNASAAGGLQLSSANLESLGKFAEGTAAQYQQQAFNQWMSQNNLTLTGLQNMVQTGQVSAAQLQSALAAHGISVETLQSAIGQARADGTLGAATATANGVIGSANSLTAAEQAAAGFTANGQNANAAYLAQGGNQSALALGSGLEKSANYLAGGVTGAANATAAGDVAAAGYTAGGITGAAGAAANGITGAANANAAGTVSTGNIIGSGVSGVGQQLLSSGALGSLVGGVTKLFGGGATMDNVGPRQTGAPLIATKDQAMADPNYGKSLQLSDAPTNWNAVGGSPTANPSSQIGGSSTSWLDKLFPG